MVIQKVTQHILVTIRIEYRLASFVKVKLLWLTTIFIIKTKNYQS